jgi:type IV pilus assembly protein PilM
MIRKDYFKISGPVVGVDIGYDTLKVVQTRHLPGGRAHLTGYSRVSIPPRSTQRLQDGKKILAEALRKAFQEARPHPIQTTNVVSGLPESNVFTTVIQVPPMDLSEMAQAVPLEAMKYIPMPLDNLNIDFQPLAPNTSGTIDVLVVAAPKSLVERYVNIFESAGLNLFALETKPIANSRSLLSQTDKDTVLIVDIGAEGTGLTLFDNRVIRFTTSLPQGGNIFTKSIAKKLSISEEDAEARKIKYGVSRQDLDIADAIDADVQEIIVETKRAINYFEERSSKDKQVEEIRLCGGAALTPALAEMIAKKTGKPTNLGNLFVNLTPRSEKILAQEHVMRYTTAIGLSLKRGFF